MILIYCPVDHLHAVSKSLALLCHFSKSSPPPLGYGAPPQDLEESLAYRGTFSGTGKSKFRGGLVAGLTAYTYELIQVCSCSCSSTNIWIQPEFDAAVSVVAFRIYLYICAFDTLAQLKKTSGAS